MFWTLHWVCPILSDNSIVTLNQMPVKQHYRYAVEL